MPIQKIIQGYVVQVMNTETGKCISQEFIASDSEDWEDDYGDAVCPDDYDASFEEFPLEMVQPTVKLSSYLILFEEFDPEGNEFQENEHYFQAEDEYHATNQLLDFYRNLNNKVSCVKSVKRVS